MPTYDNETLLERYQREAREDEAYEQARQARLDAGREIQIGDQVFLMNDRRRPMGRLIRSRVEPHFAKDVGVQRSVNCDPNPNIPFSDPEAPMFGSNLEAVIYGFIFGLAIGAIFIPN